MRYQRPLLLIVIGWYLILAVGHYFDLRPFWNDERCVFISILRLPPQELFTHPLMNEQAFPRLYLWVIAQYSLIFNPGCLSLRVFSLIAMLGAFFVWLKVANKILHQSWDTVLYTGAWSASMPLVYYAAELKPYSMDVLIAGVIVLFLIEEEQLRQNPHAYKTSLFLLPFLGLWSYPAIFLLLLPLYHLIRDCSDEHRPTQELALFLTGYLIMLSLVYYCDFRVSTGHLLEVFWHDYFISIDSPKHFFRSLGKGLNNLTSRRFAESPRWVETPSRIFISAGLIYTLTTCWGQFKKDAYKLRSLLTITAVMLFLQLLLAILRIYPFGVARMSLFFSPVLFLVTILSFRLVDTLHKTAGITVRIAFAGYLLFLTLGIASDIFIAKHLGAISTLYSEQRLQDRSY